MASAELDKLLNIIITSINLLLSIVLCGMCFYIAKKPYEHMSKSLKIYFQCCLEPYAFLLVIISIFMGFHYLIFNDKESMLYHTLRLSTAICCQQVRLSYYFIVAGRIVATVFYKAYSKYSNSYQSLAITIAITYLTSFINGYFEYLRVFREWNGTFNAVYIVLATHLVTLILCKILYLVNHFKYKSLAYQSSLSERHQIYENVKILKTLWPMILIFSLIAPLGPLGTLTYKFQISFLAPNSVFNLGYNASFMGMIIWRLKKPKIRKMQGINVIGRNDNNNLRPLTSRKSTSKVSPEFVPVEQYFIDLQKQWN